MLHGIAQQVGGEALQGVEIAPHPDRIVRQFACEAHAFGQGLVIRKVSGLMQRGAQIDLHQGGGLDGLGASEVEKSLRQIEPAAQLAEQPFTRLGIHRAIPLEEQHKRDLSAKFITVIRATLKGNLMVAAAQGMLGGFIFWVLGIQAPVLWGVLMAFLSLLPAVGAGLIWGPVAIYFLATGALWQAGVLTAFGVGVIGLVDNLLRPLLVGKDTKMPDYVVLISTLGGMTLFGINGFVIGPVIAALFMACWDLATPKNP